MVGTEGLRALKSRRTRESIAGTALDMFATRGYAQVTIEEIAAAAEVAPSTVYRHFASKERLVLHFTRGGMDAVLDHVRAAPEGTPIAEALTAALIHGLATFDDAAADRALVAQVLIERNPDLRAATHGVLAEFRRGVAEEMARREPSAARTLAPALGGALVAAVYELSVESWRAAGGRTPARQFAAEAIELLAIGGIPLPSQDLGPARATLDAARAQHARARRDPPALP